MSTYITLERADLIASVLTSACMLAGTVFALVTIETAGRRRLMAGSFAGLAAMMAVGWGVAAGGERALAEGRYRDATPAWALTVVLSLVFAFAGVGESSVLYLFASEAHALPVRAFGSSLALVVFNLGAVSPVLFSWSGLRVGFWFRCWFGLVWFQRG